MKVWKDYMITLIICNKSAANVFILVCVVLYSVC